MWLRIIPRSREQPGHGQDIDASSCDYEARARARERRHGGALPPALRTWSSTCGPWRGRCSADPRAVDEAERGGVGRGSSAGDGCAWPPPLDEAGRGGEAAGLFRSRRVAGEERDEGSWCSEGCGTRGQGRDARGILRNGRNRAHQKLDLSFASRPGLSLPRWADLSNQTTNSGFS
jgi:hypothetical protein